MSQTNITSLLYHVLGIRGAKGAPLPRLCFAQLALTFNLATVFAIKALHYNRPLSVTIGVVAIGTLGTWALPDKERNLSARNQKVLMY